MKLFRGIGVLPRDWEVTVHLEELSESEADKNEPLFVRGKMEV